MTEPTGASTKRLWTTATQQPQTALHATPLRGRIATSPDAASRGPLRVAGPYPSPSTLPHIASLQHCHIPTNTHAPPSGLGAPDKVLPSVPLPPATGPATAAWLGRAELAPSAAATILSTSSSLGSWDSSSAMRRFCRVRGTPIDRGQTIKALRASPTQGPSGTALQPEVHEGIPCNYEPCSAMRPSARVCTAQRFNHVGVRLDVACMYFPRIGWQL